MKKLLVVLAIVCISYNANAQDEFVADTQKLVETISKDAFKPYIAQFVAMVPAEKQEAFKGELMGTMPELYGAMATIYMEEFNHQEIKELLAFYDTPVGKKMAEKSGELSQKGMTAGQAWGMKVQEIIGKYQ